MKLSVNEDRSFLLEDVYNGVLFRTKEGQELGVCMRDGGFEINIIQPNSGDYSWHRIINGNIESFEELKEEDKK